MVSMSQCIFSSVQVQITTEKHTEQLREFKSSFRYVLKSCSILKLSKWGSCLLLECLALAHSNSSFYSNTRPLLNSFVSALLSKLTPLQNLWVRLLISMNRLEILRNYWNQDFSVLWKHMKSAYRIYRYSKSITVKSFNIKDGLYWVGLLWSSAYIFYWRFYSCIYLSILIDWNALHRI